MGIRREPITYRGRNIGLLVLVSAQFFIGAIHILFGLILTAFGSSLLSTTAVYDAYTLAFGVSTSVLALYVWLGKKKAWVGTVVVSLFVTIADVLVVLNLPSIPGIPFFAAPTEIVYSVLVIGYLLTGNMRKKFHIS